MNTTTTFNRSSFRLSPWILALVFLMLAVFVLPRPAAAEGRFLDATTYYLTTNTASQTITITNWPGSSAGSFEWYPAALLYNNRNDTTGTLVKVDHVRARSGYIMSTNLTLTTNTLFTFQSGVAFSTNYVFTGRFYVVPTTDKLVITSVSTNGELILIREINH